MAFCVFQAPEGANRALTAKNHCTTTTVDAHLQWLYVSIMARVGSKDDLDL